MRKAFATALLVLTVTLVAGSGASAASQWAEDIMQPGTLFGQPDPCPDPENKVRFLPNAKGINRVVVNKEWICFPDAQPGIINGRTLVPVRFVSQALGAKVDWDDATRTVTITGNGRTIVLPVGQAAATVNGQPVTFDVPANIYLDRTYVPLRFVSEALGAKVDWDAAEYRVYITMQR